MSDYIKHKEYKLPDGRTVTADFNELGCAMVTIQALDALFDMLNSSQQWIPCSERLPEESGRYLATRGLKTTGPLWNRVYIVNYSDLMGLKSERIWWDGNVGKSDFRRLEDVIAWMPLPEPYKGEKA